MYGWVEDGCSALSAYPESCVGVAIQSDDVAYKTMRAACRKVMDRVKNIHIS